MDYDTHKCIFYIKIFCISMFFFPNLPIIYQFYYLVFINTSNVQKKC